MRGEDISGQLSDYQLLKKDSPPCSYLCQLFIFRDHLSLHKEISDIDSCPHLYEIFTD
jgi:hypothetical protein